MVQLVYGGEEDGGVSSEDGNGGWTGKAQTEEPWDMVC